MTDNQVFTGSDSRGLKLSARLIVLLAAIGVVVISLGGLAFWYFSNVTGSDTTRTAPAIVQERAQDLKDQGDYAAAATYSTRKYESAGNDAEKYKIALQAATSYESKQDCKQAIVWYKKAYELKRKDTASPSGLGRCYEASGDMKLAAEYYQKTIDNYKVAGDKIATTQNDIKYYEQKLQKVRAQ